MPRKINFHDEDIVLIVYQIYACLLFSIMILLYPYVIYLIAFRSPTPMHVYRKFLLAITTFDFLYSFALNFLYQPVPLFPAIGGLSLGFASYGGSDTLVWASFFLTIIATVGTIFAQCYSLVYRFVIFKSTLRWMNLFNKKLTHFTLCGYCILATFIIIVGVLFVRADPDVFYERARNISMIPVRPTDTVFGFYLSSGWFSIWMAYVVFNLCFAVIGSFVFLYLIFNILTTRVSHMSKNTIKIQWNFAKASFIQLLLPIIFLYFPALFCGFQLTIGFLNSKILIYISIYLLNAYPVANSLVTIFYISSYRKQTIFLCQKLFSCVLPKWRKNSITTTNNLTIASFKTEQPMRKLSCNPTIIVTRSF